MPQIRVVPSVELSDKDSLLKEISKEVSNLTGKNEQWVMASIEPNVSMSFSGSTDPCCYAELKNIGEIDGSKCQGVLSKLISDKTGIPTDRIFIRYENIPGNRWGFNDRMFG